MGVCGLYKSPTILLFAHFGSFYVFLVPVYTLPLFATLRPTDDREKTDT